MQEPFVSIVIPHYQGREMLYKCLFALLKTDYKNLEIIVVDNASTDGSVDALSEDFGKVVVTRNQENCGYAGGCNSGFLQSKGEFVLFLNDDTFFDSDWLKPLVGRIISDQRIAAVQPKLLAAASPEKFDYSGAAGGLMDIFGFPFSLGRLFFSLEEDRGQYDQSREIFWASGTAFLVRRSVIEQVGLFDESFFAHMEEIDLNWRMMLVGYKIVSEPASVVYHNSGSTLRPDSFKKMYLNHRNSILMLLKNYEFLSLVWILPIRLFLDLMAVGFALIKLDFTRLRAIIAAHFGALALLPTALKNRVAVVKIRAVRDKEIWTKMYFGSIVFGYFFRRRKIAAEYMES